MRILLLALLFSSWASFSWAANNPNGVAVIIGNKNYASSVPTVDYAHNDAKAIRQYVIDVLGFREGNIIDLRDATQTQLLSVFGNERTHEGTIWQYVRPNKSDVVVFYSGHGVPGQKDQRGYLLPVDANPDTPEINGYPIDLLYKNLSKIKSRTTTLFLDTCFSGESAKGMLIRSASPIHINAKMPSLAKGMTVITAAQGDQLASWDDKAQQGLFTEYLLEALYGKADEKGYGNGNGKVTLKEIRTYLDEEMTYAARRRFSRHQQATVLGDDESVLASHSPGRPFKRTRVAAQIPALPVPKPSPQTATLETPKQYEGTLPQTTPESSGQIYGAENEYSRILVIARENSWIQVRDNIANRLVLTRLLRAGDSYRAPDQPGLILLTGNAGALEIFVDGESVPNLGGAGKVRRNVRLDPDLLRNEPPKFRPPQPPPPSGNLRHTPPPKPKRTRPGDLLNGLLKNLGN